ncbi:hypothetical protein F5Y16DRAFT_414319 [Xylariaceae sp. FL0255]|nr:hypothetical protein F5Y16DRAFT_414319 [Xylariaceae sp. FL0255]
MPHFRGIGICMVASHQAKELPEYPHPDGSSVRLVPPASSLTIADHVDPMRQTKLNPCISVYVPSVPGEQFWLRYIISGEPPPAPYLFFKLAMNGRHIASWGIDTHTCGSRSVMRALYEPQEEPGIESRYFHFANYQNDTSVANDGGLIKVHVFRCNARKRIAPNSPSGGLVTNPEDAMYFNYYLADAKDSPYATFCFHYRSMNHLRQLHLAPQRQTSTSSQASDSAIFKLEASSQASGSSDGDEVDTEITGSDGVPEQIGNIPDYCASSVDLAGARVSQTPADEQTTVNPQRPLPNVPTPHLRPASAASLRSNCPSLTPSLRHYVESDDFENEDIRLSTAQPLLIPSESMQALKLDAANADEQSASDYASSPSSTTETFQSPPGLPSGGYIPTTGSVLERQLRQYDSPGAIASPLQDRGKHLSSNMTGLSDQEDNLRFTEEEWLRHSPSPPKWAVGPIDGPCSQDPRSPERTRTKSPSNDGPDINREMNHCPPGNWI